MNYFAGKIVRVLLLCAVSTVLLAGFAAAAETEQAVAVGATTGSSLRMRSAASTSASVVTTLDEGVVVAVLDGSTDGWHRVSYNGKVGFVSADYLAIDQDNVFTSYGRVTGDGVCVRSTPSTEGATLATVDADAIVTVNGFVDGWYDVTCKYGTEGYIRSDFVTLTNSDSSGSNSDIVALAKQHLGTRYSYGGASPSGFDCSGFVRYVYSQFGCSLNRTASAQMSNGTSVSMSELQPGDLVFFLKSGSGASRASHVGIYIGGGQFIHASTSSTGVIISDMDSAYYTTGFVGGRRIL